LTLKNLGIVCESSSASTNDESINESTMLLQVLINIEHLNFLRL